MRITNFIIVACFVVFEVDTFLTDGQFGRSMKYIETYNELEIKAVVLVIKEDSADNTIVIENIFKGDDNTRYPRYFSYHATPLNKSIIKHQLLDNSSPSLVVLQGFGPDMELVNFMSDFPVITLRNHCWLIVFNSIFKNEKILQDDISLLFSLTDRKSEFDIQSLIHIVARINSAHYLFEFYYKCGDQPLVFHKLIALEDVDDENVKGLNIWERRKDLSYCKLKVGYFQDSPFVSEENSKTNLVHHRRVLELGGKIMYGREVQMFQLLHTIMNFSVIWEYVADEKFGSHVEDTDDWNGIIGMITQKEIDTSLIPLSVTPERRVVVQFAYPIRKYEYRLFLKKPKPSLQWDTYYAVFNPDLWISWIVIVLMCTFVIYFIFFYLDRGKKKKNIVMDSFAAICTTLLASMALDTFQASNTNGRFQITKKAILFTVCGFGMIIYYSYNAILISSLMVQDDDIPLKNIRDLLNYPSYKCMILAGTSSETYLKESPEDWVQEIWAKVVSNKGNISSLNGVEEKLLSDQYHVLLYTYPDIPMMFKSYPCKITAHKSARLIEYASYAFHQESPYVELFSYYMSYIVEKGLETEYFDRHEESSILCDEDNERNFMSITFEGVISAFVLVVVGCLLASACFFAEKSYSGFHLNVSKHKRKSRRPTFLRINNAKVSLEYLNVTKTSKFYRFDEI